MFSMDEIRSHANTEQVPIMQKVAAVLAELETKPKGHKLSPNDDLIPLGVAVVMVCDKDDLVYFHYARSVVTDGASTVYMMARGEDWIDKALDVAGDLVSARVLEKRSVKFGKTTIDDRLLRTVLVTMTIPGSNVAS